MQTRPGLCSTAPLYTMAEPQPTLLASLLKDSSLAALPAEVVGVIAAWAAPCSGCGPDRTTACTRCGRFACVHARGVCEHCHRVACDRCLVRCVCLGYLPHHTVCLECAWRCNCCHQLRSPFCRVFCSTCHRHVCALCAAPHCPGMHRLCSRCVKQGQRCPSCYF